MLVRDALLPDPRPGDVIVTPATGAYGYALANNYNGQPRPPVVFCSGGTHAWWCAARPTRSCMAATSEVFRVACWATAPSAGLRHPARRSVPAPSPRPSACAPSSRRADPLAGDFESILEGSDLIVELIGGIEPAREYVLRAMRAGKHVVSANKQLLSQHGEELWAVAREHTSSCASRAPSPAWCR